MKNKLKEVKNHLEKIEKINEAINVLYWDMRTYMPKDGIDSRIDVIEYLSGEAFSLTNADEVKGFIDYFKDKMESLSDVDKAMITKMTKNYNETMKIPKDRYQAFVNLCSKSESAWEEAKTKNDFNIFKPYLKQVIDFEKEFIGYWGYEGNTQCRLSTLVILNWSRVTIVTKKFMNSNSKHFATLISNNELNQL